MRHRRSNTLANIREMENQYEIALAVPGFDKSELTIKVEDRVLTIHADKEDVNKGYTYREFNYQKVDRSFKLPKTVDVDNISANLINGILTLSLTKVPEAQPKQISIV